jgi:hypothetical protein
MIEQLIQTQTRELDRLTLDELRRVNGAFTGARDRLRKRLDAWIEQAAPAYLRRRGIGQEDRWTTGHSQAVMAQLESGLQAMGKRLEGLMQEGGKRADAAQVEHWMRLALAAEEEFGVGLVNRIDLGTVLRFSETEGTLLGRYAKGSKRWTRSAVDAARGILAEGVAGQESIDRMIDRLSGDNGPLLGQRWAAQRLVRTEFVNRYNERAMEGLKASAEEDAETRKRLVTPMDARTDRDSLMIVALEGNLVRPVGEAFEDPYHGTTFQYPPNRPNDRSRVVMWMPGWGDGWKGQVKKARVLLAARPGKPMRKAA